MSHSCQSCLLDLGGSTGRQALVCGRCKGATYCSADCQKSDYPRHKTECLRAAASKKALEQSGKVVPGMDRFIKDADRFCNSIHLEAAAAARSTLRFGTPNSLHDSHYLVLGFEYNHSDVPLRQRFTYKRVSIEPFEGGAWHAPMDDSRRQSLLDARARMRNFRPPTTSPLPPVDGEAYITFVTTVRVEWQTPSGRLMNDFNIISTISRLQMTYFERLPDWPPNLNLHALLRRLFSAPNPLPSHSIFRDDYLTTYSGREAQDARQMRGTA
ncbi:hypothetical protein BCR35DRAFT_353096 [Leucosporidium creatinivorum]|uniref:MYND-type domain-containing protein n=1 Tax=Leucosporidium creatinivorum TaxID=106004 RepID=A0A1Y2F115_9BASI|nr:hypothetical protein BCR35DRAFT_353096 [Leucosporidium creatinivorum]